MSSLKDSLDRGPWSPSGIWSIQATSNFPLKRLQLNLQVEAKQRQVALVSEMIHTASLLHDDILDRALTRRGKPSVNANWDARKSTFAGICGEIVAT